MSLQNEDAVVSGYGSSDETASLLVLSKNKHTIVASSQSRGNISKILQQQQSVNGPASSSGVSKPVLTRQECTSSYLISPNTSQLGGSEESGGPGDDDHLSQQYSSQLVYRSAAIRPYQTSLSVNATSVPDLDAQYHLEAPIISISTQSCRSGHRGSVSGYQLTPQARCRTCRTCERRASATPVSSLYLARSVRTKIENKTKIHKQTHTHTNLTNTQRFPSLLFELFFLNLLSVFFSVHTPTQKMRSYRSCTSKWAYRSIDSDMVASVSLLLSLYLSIYFYLYFSICLCPIHHIKTNCPFAFIGFY